MPPALTPAILAFLEHEGSQVPDFSGCLVLVPHHHAGLAFRQALSAALPGQYLLPPRLLTLPELAAEADLDTQPEADCVRLAQLRDFLEGTGQLQKESFWDAAQELLVLVNELDGLDAAEAALIRIVPGSNRYLSIEAGIAQAVWRVFSKSGTPGRTRVHAWRLAWLAGRAVQPLYTLNLGAMTGQERAFLKHWQMRAPVIDLPAPLGYPERQALLNAVWEEGDIPLPERARRFFASHSDNPLDHDVVLLSAAGLETAARAAEQTLLDWLASGMHNIALIALDRLVARRLRALLERRGILLQDETGWAFSTASASHAVECWLRVATGDAWFRDLLDILKSPFVFADAGDQRLQAAHELDDAFRRHGAPDGLAGHLDLARREGLHAAHVLLKRIERAGAGFNRGRQPLHEWTRRLLDSLAALAADTPLRADPVGRQLWRLLDRLAQESSGHEMRYSLADWRLWLFMHLEQTTFQDDTVSSPLRLTHLAAAHTRELEGAILLGVGAAHLPGLAPSGIFNDATRLQLGLPGTEARERDLRVALTDVMARTPRVALVWQSEQQGDPAPLSPWLVHLDAFHRAAWGGSLVTRYESAPTFDDPLGSGLAAPVLYPVAETIPERLSVSAWQSLVDCPYQFHARHLLKLNERDEVPEEMDKADYGSLVHRILARFHTVHPDLDEAMAGPLEAELRALSRQVFAEAEARSFLATVWRLRWERRIESYLDWALQRARDGYRFQSAEAALAREVAWGEGKLTQLHGRADRLDEKDGGTALLDYKTQSRQTLRNKLAADGEDVQLTAYAWLADAAEAGFVSVDADKVETLDWPEGLPEAVQAEAARLRDVLAGMAEGSPLPAQGAPNTCSWCEMRGLCRREHQGPSQA